MQADPTRFRPPLCIIDIQECNPSWDQIGGETRGEIFRTVILSQPPGIVCGLPRVISHSMPRACCSAKRTTVLQGDLEKATLKYAVPSPRFFMYVHAKVSRAGACKVLISGATRLHPTLLTAYRSQKYPLCRLIGAAGSEHHYH